MTSELGRRVAFTLGALLVYRIGSYIPLPGIDASVWSRFFSDNAGGVLGLANITAGGAVARLGIFALGITPYLSAAIFLQLLMFVSSRLRALRNNGDRGRTRIIRLTLVLTLLIALVQANGLALALQRVDGLVIEPGLSFTVAATLTLTTGALVLVWLTDQITLRGVGNGIALILFAGIVAELPAGIAGLLELGRQGVLSSGFIAVLAILAVMAVALVVLMELARRRLQVRFVARQVGMADRQAHLSLKLNSAGIIPALLASWAVFLPRLVTYLIDPVGPSWWTALNHELDQGRPLGMGLYAVAIIACTFLYTALVLDPSEAAQNLERHGGVIPGVAPGEDTAAHVDTVLTRTTLLGAVYLAIVCLAPELLISYAHVPFSFGGTSLLVLVCTALDVTAHLQGDAAVNVGALT